MRTKDRVVRASFLSFNHPEIQSMNSNANVAANIKMATRRCASERRSTVFHNSTLPVCRARVASTACEYSVSICAACVCTCDANNEESADISSTDASARRTCSATPANSSANKSLSDICVCVWSRPENPTPSSPSLSSSGAAPTRGAPLPLRGVANARGGGARLRLRSASASTFLNRTSLHWSNAEATFASRSVTMRTTPCRCATVCGVSSFPAARACTVDLSMSTCAWHAWTLRRTSVSMSSRVASASSLSCKYAPRFLATNPCSSLTSASASCALLRTGERDEGGGSARGATSRSTTSVDPNRRSSACAAAAARNAALTSIARRQSDGPTRFARVRYL
mmetsp:Transcript_15066/g.63531  ORF Transcript_15066/g.63531 Transcript_15066/m.63531 type:complete len:340 (-) Transcript_15066:9-1028(-)